MTRWPALAPYTVVSSRYIEYVFKSPRNLRRWDGGGAGTMKKLRDGDHFSLGGGGFFEHLALLWTFTDLCTRPNCKGTVHKASDLVRELVCPLV